MRTIKEVFSIAIPVYKKDNCSFMCHVLDKLRRAGDITEDEYAAGISWIERALEGEHTLCNFLLDRSHAYKALLGDNDEWKTDEALSYRVSWWETEILKLGA